MKVADLDHQPRRADQKLALRLLLLGRRVDQRQRRRRPALSRPQARQRQTRAGVCRCELERPGQGPLRRLGSLTRFDEQQPPERPQRTAVRPELQRRLASSGARHGIAPAERPETVELGVQGGGGVGGIVQGAAGDWAVKLTAVLAAARGATTRFLA